ncbi:unnamed protein product, partial [Polarella glacialis]
MTMTYRVELSQSIFQACLAQSFLDPEAQGLLFGEIEEVASGQGTSPASSSTARVATRASSAASAASANVTIFKVWGFTQLLQSGNEGGDSVPVEQLVAASEEAEAFSEK